MIEVITPGLLTTVQDQGRAGFGPMGVSRSGAADALAFRLGNLLLGNDQNAPALEMTLMGGVLRFPEGGVVALTGSDFGARLDDARVTPWTATQIKLGETLRIGPTRSGARCYLCVYGGIQAKSFLGSASTHVLTHLGGFEGRALRGGDALQIGSQPFGSQPSGPQQCRFEGRTLRADFVRYLETRKLLRVTAAPQSDWFDEASTASFYGQKYTVAEQSNRMGIRLIGLATPSIGREMISEGTALGAIQIPPGGQPIIVFVEQQTTGGYPKIANVISADFHSLGQLRPRDEIGFELIELAAARALLVEQEQMLASEEIFSH